MKHYLDIIKILYLIYFKIKFGRKFDSIIVNHFYAYHIDKDVYILFRKQLSCLHVNKVELIDDSRFSKLSKDSGRVVLHNKRLISLIQTRLTRFPIVDIEVKERDEKFEKLFK